MKLTKNDVLLLWQLEQEFQKSFGQSIGFPPDPKLTRFLAEFYPKITSGQVKRAQDAAVDLTSAFFVEEDFFYLTKSNKKMLLDLLEMSDFESLIKYGRAIRDWYSGYAQGFVKQQQEILKGRTLIEQAYPLKLTFENLYRGLTNLKKIPRDGQRVFYTSSGHRLLSGWTPSRSVAVNFASNGSNVGVLLRTSVNDVLKSGQFVLWPGFVHNGYAQEKEYVIHLKRPLPVIVEDTY